MKSFFVIFLGSFSSNGTSETTSSHKNGKIEFTVEFIVITDEKIQISSHFLAWQALLVWVLRNMNDLGYCRYISIRYLLVTYSYTWTIEMC